MCVADGRGNLGVDLGANRGHESGQIRVNILSPFPVDKFVDNLPKFLMPYCFIRENINLPNN